MAGFLFDLSSYVINIGEIKKMMAQVSEKYL
jgi:hypothetical protein